MTRSLSILLRLSPEDMRRWRAALRDGETMSSYLREAADRLARERRPPEYLACPVCHAPRIELDAEGYLIEHYQSATDDSCPGGAR